MELQIDGALGEQTGPYSEEDKAILDGQETQEQTEELIGGKFKSADDLLQAYQELEKKLGSNTGYQKTEEETKQEEPEAQETEAVVLSEDQENTIIESIGGKDNFSTVQQWANTELDEAELEAYNREVNSGDYFRARNALQSMFFAYQENNGTEPDLVSGKLSSRSNDVYRSSAEVVSAMSDERYLQDPAYTRDVEEKLSRSDVLAPT